MGIRVALCLSGLSTKTLNTNLINAFNKFKNEQESCDIFVHTWTHDSVPEVISSLMPTRHQIENPKVFKNSKIQLSEYNLERFFPYLKDKPDPSAFLINNNYSMWYGIRQCLLLKELYALENDFTYDYVVRCRLDVCPNPTIKCSDYSKDTLYHLNLQQPYDMVSDWFGFGSNSIMNAYGSTFLHIEEAYNFLKTDIGVWCNELFLKYTLDKHNIKTKAILSDDVVWG